MIASGWLCRQGKLAVAWTVVLEDKLAGRMSNCFSERVSDRCFLLA